MKYNILNSFLAMALVLTVLASGCKKDDVTAPVITVTGSNPMTHNLGAAFTDPGATAVDDVDGDITVVATGTVNINAAGSNTITYTATDAAGNSATATRVVNVVMTRDAILGNYSTTTTCTAYPYNTVATNTTFKTNSSASKFVIDMFYFNGGTLTCTLAGSAVTVDAGQNPNPIQDGVTGSGTFNAAGKVLTMNYTFQPNGGSPTTCSVTYTRP
jgi:hypothetical protein